MTLNARRTLVVGALLTTVFALLRAEFTRRAWQQMLDTGLALEETIEDAETLRPVLHGEPLAGLAFDEYHRAAELLSETAHADFLAYQSARAESEDSARELRDALLDDHKGMFDALDRGARSVDGRYPVAWKHGFEFTHPGLRTHSTLAKLNTLGAERHLDLGQPALAVDALLNGMQLSRDLIQSRFLINEMVGAALLASVSKDALIDDGLIERLPASELTRLAEGMRVLDEAIAAPTRSWDGEIASLTNTVSRAFQSDASMHFSVSSLIETMPFLFSARAMLADYTAQAMRDRDIMYALDDATWPEREAALTAIAAKSGESANAHYGRFAEQWLAAEISRRRCTTLFRLTRMAIEYRATGRAHLLPDPFGGTDDVLQLVELTDQVRFEAAGQPCSKAYAFEIRRNQ